MSGHGSHASQPPAGGTPPAAGGIVARLLRPVNNLLHWVKAKPLVAGPILGAVLVALAGGVYLALALRGPEKKEPSIDDYLALAFEHLDAAEYAEAREEAAALRPNPKLDSEQLAASLYILGKAMAHDAEIYQDTAQRQLLFRVAARYFEEARNHGMPEDREADGLFQLGRCLKEGGRNARAIEAFLEALTVEKQPQATELHRLLAETYLLLRPPQINPAIEQINSYLRDPQLSPREQHEGWLWQARIQLQKGDLANCLAALENIPAESSFENEKLLLETQVLIAEAETLTNAGKNEPAREKTAAAVEKLRGFQNRDGSDRYLVPQVIYLHGLLHERLGDDAEAEHHWTRVVKEFNGTTEGLASQFRLGSLFIRKGEHAEGVQRFRQALAAASLLAPYENRWLGKEEVEARLQTSFEHLSKANEYALAIEFASAWTPFSDEFRGLLARATAHRSWAQLLEKEAAEMNYGEGVSRLADARQQWRKAAQDYAKLAGLRAPTKFYEEDVWNAADAYMRGQQYPEAATQFRRYLKERVRQRRPEVLAGLGDALLAQGKFKDAIEIYTQCLTEYPKHPASYRSRLQAALALLEEDKLEDARQLLVDNLYNFALTPQSPEWRDSLFALGESMFRDAAAHETQSRVAGVDDRDPVRREAGLTELEKAHQLYLEAARILTEAVERFPSAPRAAAARYRVAESWRQAAKWPRKRLDQATIETTRVLLTRQLQEYLGLAIAEFTKLQQQFDTDQSAVQRSPTEMAIIRNCYFGKADALFDLGRYEDAALAYSAATNRYQHEPEALEAYVQVAACYRRLNRFAEARGTLEHARVVLRRIRADADFRRTTRFTREEWGEMIDWLASL